MHSNLKKGLILITLMGTISSQSFSVMASDGEKNLGELDFVIEMGGKIIPIEVKSGKAYKSHKALDNFMSISDYHLEKAYIFSTGNVERESNMIYLPIYMCYLLKERKLEQMIVELDISGL